jgi:hypothetical protein
MPSHWHNCSRRTVGNIAVAASLLGLLVMLTSPMLKAHHFSDFYRAGQPASQIQCHIFLAQPKAGTAQVSARARAMLNTISIAIETASTETESKPLAGFELASQVPVPRLPIHLKTGSSRDSDQDPLL